MVRVAAVKPIRDKAVNSSSTRKCVFRTFVVWYNASFVSLEKKIIRSEDITEVYRDKCTGLAKYILTGGKADASSESLLDLASIKAGISPLNPSINAS